MFFFQYFLLFVLNYEGTTHAIDVPTTQTVPFSLMITLLLHSKYCSWMLLEVQCCMVIYKVQPPSLLQDRMSSALGLPPELVHAAIPVVVAGVCHEHVVLLADEAGRVVAHLRALHLAVRLAA